MCSPERGRRLSVAVVGSRTFGDRALLARVLDAVLKKHRVVCVVSGGGRGADRIAEEWARDRGVRFEVFPARWKEYGPSAGPRRNELVIGAADAVVAFWDGSSPGTADALEKARAKGIPAHVVRFGSGEAEAPAARPASAPAAEPAAPRVVLGFEEPVEREPLTVEEIVELQEEVQGEREYREDRARGDGEDAETVSWIERDLAPRSAVVKRGADVGPPKGTEDRRTGAAMPPGKAFEIDGEVSTVYPPSRSSGAQLVVLTDGRKVIVPKVHRVVRGGPLDRYRHVLKVKGWHKEVPAKDGRGTVTIVGPHAQVVDSWVPRFPRAAAAEEVPRAAA